MLVASSKNLPFRLKGTERSVPLVPLERGDSGLDPRDVNPLQARLAFVIPPKGKAAALAAWRS
jgi:hypothetical protein